MESSDNTFLCFGIKDLNNTSVENISPNVIDPESLASEIEWID